MRQQVRQSGRGFVHKGFTAHLLYAQAWKYRRKDGNPCLRDVRSVGWGCREAKSKQIVTLQWEGLHNSFTQRRNEAETGVTVGTEEEKVKVNLECLGARQMERGGRHQRAYRREGDVLRGHVPRAWRSTDLAWTQHPPFLQLWPPQPLGKRVLLSACMGPS